MNRGDGFIYFLFVPKTDSIKIGKARNLQKRLEEFRKGTAIEVERTDVEFLSAIRTDTGNEKAIHQEFKDVRIGNSENFGPLGDQRSRLLGDYVRWLRAQPWTVADERESEYAPRRDWWEWCPLESRRIAPSSAGPLFEGDNRDFRYPELLADDYFTPTRILEAARIVLGHIDLDPASHPHANRNVKARRFYTHEDDGLKQDWGGRVWLNPPFSRYQEFIEKLISEIPHIESACCLTSTVKITAHYYDPLLRAAAAMCVMTGRHNHLGRGEGKQSTHGHLIFYIGKDSERFARAFRDLGTIWSHQ